MALPERKKKILRGVRQNVERLSPQEKTPVTGEELEETVVTLLQEEFRDPPTDWDDRAQAFHAAEYVYTLPQVEHVLHAAGYTAEETALEHGVESLVERGELVRYRTNPPHYAVPEADAYVSGDRRE